MKKFIHFNSFDNFKSKRLSARADNTTSYYLDDPDIYTSDIPEIKWLQIVFIKDTQSIWTHGQLYSGKDSNTYLENYVTKEEIETHEEIAATALADLNNKLETHEEVSAAAFASLNNKISNLDLNIFELVTTLPTSDIKENKIYLVPSSVTGTNNIYTEYKRVNSAWEKLGEYKSDVDLSDYAKSEDIPTTLDDLADGTTRKLSNYLPLNGGTLAGTINSQDVLPKTNNTYNLGNNTYRYNSIWGGVLNVGTDANNTNYGPGYIQSTNSWFSLIGPGSITANEHSWTTLAIGNNNLYTSTDSHLGGTLRLYGLTAGSHAIYPETTENNYNHYLPNTAGENSYLVSSPKGVAVGSSTQPVYINANGEAVACDNSIPDTGTFILKIADWHGNYNCQGDYYWHFADITFTAGYYFAEGIFRFDSRHNPPFDLYAKASTGENAFLGTGLTAFIFNTTGTYAKCYYVEEVTDTSVVYKLYILHKNCDSINYQLIHKHNFYPNNSIINLYDDVVDNRVTELPTGAVEITKKNEFVSLSGDTMTGALTINNNDYNHLTLQGYNNRSDILFKTNLNKEARIGIDDNWGRGIVMLYNNAQALSISPLGLSYNPDGTENWKTVLHTGAQTLTDAEKTLVKTNLGIEDAKASAELLFDPELLNWYMYKLDLEIDEYFSTGTNHNTYKEFTRTLLYLIDGALDKHMLIFNNGFYVPYLEEVSNTSNYLIYINTPQLKPGKLTIYALNKITILPDCTVINPSSDMVRFHNISSAKTYKFTSIESWNSWCFGSSVRINNLYIYCDIPINYDTRNTFSKFINSEDHLDIFIKTDADDLYNYIISYFDDYDITVYKTL